MTAPALSGGMPALTLPHLLEEAARFAGEQSLRAKPALFGVTDGKAIGPSLEHECKTYLRQQGDYDYDAFVSLENPHRNGITVRDVDFPGRKTPLQQQPAPLLLF